MIERLNKNGGGKFWGCVRGKFVHLCRKLLDNHRLMIIKQVTVTGADESVTPQAMLEIQQRHPFVEWGILLSKSAEGRSRFPSLDWLNGLVEGHDVSKFNLSGHLCGRWVRDICKGNWTFIEYRAEIC